MSHKSERIISAVMFALIWIVVFALIWMVGMLGWFYPTPGVMHPALLVLGAVIAGLFWYWVHGRSGRNGE
jgi:hypothetical protein